MTFHDLRSFLAGLERECDLVRVAAMVDPYLESTALCLRALRESGPALLMERPLGSKHALLGNLFGHRRRIERALGGRPLASLRELGRLLAAVKEPRWPASCAMRLRNAPSSRSSRTSRRRRCVTRASSTKGARWASIPWERQE